MSNKKKSVTKGRKIIRKLKKTPPLCLSCGYREGDHSFCEAP